MGREAFRFAVGEPQGLRSEIWRAWHSGSGDDVYVAARVLGGMLKVSLHRAGDCYAGLTSEFARQAKAQGMLAPGTSRQQLRWVGRPLSEDFSLLLRVVIPTSELAPLGNPRPVSKPVVWIPPAPAGHVTEFAFIIGRPGMVFPEWPGARSMGTQQVGRFILPSGTFCHAVWRHTDEMRASVEEQIREMRRRALLERERWLTPEVATEPGTFRTLILGYDNKYRIGVLVEAGLGDVTDVAS